MSKTQNLMPSRCRRPW